MFYCLSVFFFFFFNPAVRVASLQKEITWLCKVEVAQVIKHTDAREKIKNKASFCRHRNVRQLSTAAGGRLPRSLFDLRTQTLTYTQQKRQIIEKKEKNVCFNQKTSFIWVSNKNLHKLE